MAIERVVSGMRPTGSLHLGHYNGVLKNWVDLDHFKVLWHTWDPVGSTQGNSSTSTSILHQPQRYTELALWRVKNFCKDSLSVISL